MEFGTLREANVARLPTFKNARGEVVHNADGSDWTLSQWLCAVLGELGELANIVKKFERGDFSNGLEELVDYKDETITLREMMAKEFADVVTYLDIGAFRAGVDLGQAVVEKFNEISARVGSPIYIERCDETGKYVMTDTRRNL